MKYADIEDAIAARLSTALGTTATVVTMPEYQAQNQRPFDKPRIVVAYNHSMFGEGRYGDKIPTMSTDAVAQEENISIRISIEARALRGAAGIYELLVAVRQALIGFEPLSLDKLKVVEAKFDEFAENLWRYSLTFGTKGVIVEDSTVDTDPLITEVNFNQNFPTS